MPGHETLQAVQEWRCSNRSDLRRLRDGLAVPTIATVLSPAATPLSGFKPPRRWAILFGNEGHGLDETVTELCNYRLTLPMREGTDSLNVSIAAGLFLYHLTLPHEPGDYTPEGSNL